VADHYLARVLANLVYKLVEKDVLTLAEAQAITEITDADMVAGRPSSMTLAQAIDRLAAAHRISEERGGA
jgi:hypothetical protein